MGESQYKEGRFHDEQIARLTPDELVRCWSFGFEVADFGSDGAEAEIKRRLNEHDRFRWHPWEDPDHPPPRDRLIIARTIFGDQLMLVKWHHTHQDFGIGGEVEFEEEVWMIPNLHKSKVIRERSLTHWCEIPTFDIEEAANADGN